jgi:hypothetical protein
MATDTPIPICTHMFQDTKEQFYIRNKRVKIGPRQFERNFSIIFSSLYFGVPFTIAILIILSIWYVVSKTNPEQSYLFMYSAIILFVVCCLLIIYPSIGVKQHGGPDITVGVRDHNCIKSENPIDAGNIN